jgi:membrane-bound ClpP family serine protease
VSHGLLALGGAIALVTGSLLLFSGKGDVAGYRVDLGIIVPGLALTLGVVAFLTWKVLQARGLPVRSGAEGMVGAPAKVVDGFAGHRQGRVHVLGEYWEGVGPADLAAGETVRVARVKDGVVHVERRNG